jgi:hypothetical protein
MGHGRFFPTAVGFSVQDSLAILFFACIELVLDGLRYLKFIDVRLLYLFINSFIRDLFNVTFSWCDYVLYNVEWLVADDIEWTWNESIIT